MKHAIGGTKMTAILLLVFLLLEISHGEAGERWSRQLTGESNSDWVPLGAAPLNKRQASARVLTHPAPFQSNFFPAETIPSDNPPQLFLKSIPSGQQYQASYQQPLQLTLTSQYNPLAQGFVAPPNLQYNNIQHNGQATQYQPQTVNSQFVQHPSQINNQFYNNVNQGPTGASAQQLNDFPRFVDGYKVENASTDFFQASGKKKTITPAIRNNQEPVLKSQQQFTTQKASERSSTFRPTTSGITTVEKEEVQLLYVPLETLQSEQFNVKKFLNEAQKQESIRDSVGSPGQINNQLYTPTTPSYFQRQQTQLHQIQQDLVQQAFNAQNLQGKFKQNNQFDRQPKYQPTSPVALPYSQSFPAPTITTPKSKKLKAHQPPLAVFMIHKGQEKARLSDVLGVLKNAKSVSVLDNFGPNSPKIFIGPSTLRTPEHYAKFELPYLSSIDGNRIQRKVEQLPFFVAPLSYKAPQGFAKIPFPAPHVGSVIVNPFMAESQDLRPTSESLPTSFAFSSFQNPSTESFRPTVSEPTPSKQNTFSFFPSTTPSPVISSQSTASDFQSSFLPYDTSSLSPFRPLSSGRKPESDAISSSRQPLTSYFTPTPSKPTVSYFSFPEYSTLPTTNKPKSVFSSYDNRGHYITNAAIDTSAPPLKTNAPTTTTKIQTTPIPPTSPNYENHNPYSINQAFALRNPYEPINFQTNIRANEIRQYKPDPQIQNLNSESYTSFPQPPPPPPPKYSEIQNNHRPTNFQYSTISDYTQRPYFTEPIPTETEPVQPITQQSPQKINEYDTKDYSPSYNEYSSPSAEAEYEESKKITPDFSYQTETTPTRITTISTTTTTTSTTTAAPITRATRRPIHSRGRPRYTTQKPESSEIAKATTRRTPIRERKPNNNFRAKLESTKATTTSTESSVDSSNFESGKKKGEYKESAKVSTRHPSHRYKNQEEDGKQAPTTTESSLKATIATRNQRLRSRGRTHYKINQENQEGVEVLPKKTSNKKGEGDSIAYQRDVLHQNYPVTLTERMSTLEVYTSTPMPSSVDLSNGKIRIYETTGVTQKSLLRQDARLSESPLDIYDNQPIFQGEQEKFLTQPDSFIEINADNGRNTASSPGVDLYSVTQESTTASNIPSSTSQRYEEVSHPHATVVEEYYPVENENYNSNLEESIPKKEQNVEIIKHEVEATTKAVEYPSEAPTTTSEAPVPKFRSKLRARPKLLPVLNVEKQNEEEVQQHDNAAFVSNKQVEDSTVNSFAFTRRNSVHPVTYRPAFDRRRTTMRIEEIEAELKSSRQQVKSGVRPTTLKSPVYIPEATSATPEHDINSSEENDVTSTTKKNHFIRRRPVRPTTAFASTTPRTRTTTESVQENAPNKRIRVRGRLRTRPTTEKPQVVEQVEEEPSLSSQENDERYLTATQRASLQKYTTRGRQATQKYFKRPATATERSSQSSAENIDDQASYDSINRPEYIQFKPELAKPDYDFNPDGKSDGQWSPKISYNSFKPIFNPNLIADDIKQEGVEYGTKLPSEMNTEKTDIITAGNPYDDVLISVTPASNNLNMNSKAEVPEVVDIIKSNDNYEKIPETASSFESVLEEVMRSLEQQDENEYNPEYRSVMKHEGGEIGEIPPESEVEPNFTEIIKDSQMAEQEVKKKNIETGDFLSQTERIIAQSRTFSTLPDVKFQTSTTERQPRRRGVWRKVKVRPAHKDVFDTAESQFYGNSNNDLVKKDEKPKSTQPQPRPVQDVKKSVEETVSKNSAPVKETNVEKEENEEKIPPTTDNPNEDPITENISPGDMDLGTGSPNNILQMEVVNLEPTVLPVEKLQDTTAKTEYFVNPTTLPLFESENNEKAITEQDEEVRTTVQPEVEKESKVKSNITNYQIIQTSFVTEVSKDEHGTTTTEIPLGIVMETATEPEQESKKDKKQSITNVLEKILSEMDDTKKDDVTVEGEKSEDSHKIVKKTEFVENAPPSNIFDPKSIISTSVSSEISQETEICYRGRCIKTKKQDHKKVPSTP